MVEFFKTIDGRITEINEFSEGCWVNMVHPSSDELAAIAKVAEVEEEFVRAALDPEESSRVDTEDEQLLMIVDIPMVEKSSVEDGGQMFSTIPMGIVVAQNAVITVCLEDSIILRSIAEGAVKGVHTALDTAGQPFRPDDPAYLAAFDRLMANTNLVILDLKEIDPERHRQLTGKDNANILAMARHISDLGIPLWIRHVLVPGLTDDEEGLRKTADFIRSLKTVQRVEVLPYHTLGLFKWQKLGIPYPLPDAVPPTAEQVKRAEELLEVSRYPG